MTSPHSLPQPSQDTVMNDKRTTETCGGCGNYDPAQRCLGCLHEFTPAAKPVPEHISDERLAEIIKGCEGVTPGPWQRVEPGAESTLVECHNGTICEVQWNRPDVGNAHRDAAHIARLDPQTVASLLTELQHRREAEAGSVSNALLNAVAHAIEGAYVRGVEWCEENPNGGGYRFKAGSDYADKAFHDPDSELCKALAASPSYPASGVRVKAEPFCYVREWPASFDPQNGGEPASVDFSPAPKPGYEPLFKAAALGEHP